MEQKNAKDAKKSKFCQLASFAIFCSRFIHELVKLSFRSLLNYASINSPPRLSSRLAQHVCCWLECGGAGGCGQSGEAGGIGCGCLTGVAYIHDEVIPKFEKQMGALVVYDNYSSDAELEARLATGGGGYDVVFPSDRSMPALLAKGRLAEIDKGKLPNWRHLDPNFVSPPFDKGNRYSAVFLGDARGGRADRQDSRRSARFEPLFDPRYRDRITMLDDPENVIAAVLLHLGLPMNSLDPQHLARAKQLLAEQKPLVQAYTSDAYKDRLISGEAWVAPAGAAISCRRPTKTNTCG